MNFAHLTAKAAGFGISPILLALSVLWPGSLAAAGQNSGIAFWDTPVAKQAAMLSEIPADDAGRLATLRHYFIDAGCTGDRQTEQPLQSAGQRRRKKRPAGANLICTLPGESTQAIVVAAWYPEHSLYGGVTRGWPDAVALPMLYHALRAQLRRFTFVLAALSGEDGERIFLQSLGVPSQPTPLCFVGLDGLGVGDPQFFPALRKQVPSSGWPVMDTLEREALRIADLQGYGQLQQYLQAMGPVNRSIYPNQLIDMVRDIPRVMVYSGFRMSATPAAFRQDFDFTAYYLCAIDRQLKPPAQAQQ
ncbi:MAG TPA: hypothetical protein VIY53_09075 [Acidobacteriaceae bacterium]